MGVIFLSGLPDLFLFKTQRKTKTTVINFKDLKSVYNRSKNKKDFKNKTSEHVIFFEVPMMVVTFVITQG